MATKKKRAKRHLKKVVQDCWSLDLAFFKWLNEHLKVYKKDASKFIDLEYYKFDFNGIQKTQLEIINRMIELTNDILLHEFEYCTDCYIDKADEVIQLWSIVYKYMWW